MHQHHRHRRSALAVLVAVAALLAARPAGGQSDAADAATSGVMQDNVVILLDSSGSMKDRMRRGGRPKMEVAKEALMRVLQDVPESTNVGLLVFGGRNISNKWLYPLGPIDRDRLADAIRRPTPNGGTPLGQFLKIAADALLEQRGQQFGYGSYRLLVVTDGEASDVSLVERFVPDILSRGITVDVIGVDMKSNHTLATRVHSYRRADDPDSLVQAMTEVFAEVGLTGDDATDDEQFELVAAIPDDMALSMLQALARSGNQPIGEGSRRGRPASVASSGATSPPASGSNPAPSAAPTSGSGSTSKGVPGFLIIVIVVIAAIGIKVLAKIARSGGG